MDRLHIIVGHITASATQAPALSWVEPAACAGKVTKARNSAVSRVKRHGTKGEMENGMRSGRHAAYSKKQQALFHAKDRVAKLVGDNSLVPLLLVLAWNHQKSEKQGEENVSALESSVAEYLAPIKQDMPDISWADLVQLAIGASRELAGLPQMPMKFGRVDDFHRKQQAYSKASPSNELDASPDVAQQLRTAFSKYGMDDKDIAALAGMQTRARKTRQGFAGILQNANTSGTKESIAHLVEKVITSDPSFKLYANAFSFDQQVLNEASKASHKKLLESEDQFDPPEGIWM